MLILTRRINESLVIGDDVTVTIFGVKGNQVRIGVDAPRDVSVHREELAQKDDETSTSGADKDARCPLGSHSICQAPTFRFLGTLLLRSIYITERLR